MREIATKKNPVFVQANSNSGEGHVLHYITSFCVVFRLSTLHFWLAGKTETKQVVNRMSKWVERGGSWKGHESGQAARQNHHATQAIFLYWNPFMISSSWAAETKGFFPIQIVIFRMLRNNADASRCSFFELGLPLVSLHQIPWGRVLPYKGYIGVCRCEGYGFQALYSRIGYIYQNIWV